MRNYKNISVFIALSALSVILILFQNCAPMKPMGNSIDNSSNIQGALIVSFGDSLTRGANPKNTLNTGIKGYIPYLEKKFIDVDFLNCGIGGQTTADGKQRFSEIILGNYDNCSLDTVDSASTASFYNFANYQGKKPDHILLWLGTNDVLKNTPTQKESIENLRWYLREATQNNIKVTLSTIPPYGSTTFTDMSIERNGFVFDRVKTFNSLIEQVAVEFPGTIVIDSYGVLNQNFQRYTWDQVHLTSEAYVLIADLWEKALKYNQGKELFVNLNEKACVTAAGIAIPSGVAVCSCASNNLGTLSQCNDGQFQTLYSLNQSCAIAIDNQEFVAHHCKN